MSVNPLTPPKGHYWCPYSRDYKPVLTEDQVRQMWPYAVPRKETMKRSDRPEWLDEMVDEMVPRTEDIFEAPVVDRSGTPTSPDAVTLPKHYARFKIEPIRFAVENGLNVFQMNIVKYILRHDAKNGLEDLLKARRYLDMFIKFQEGDPDWWRAT